MTRHSLFRILTGAALIPAAGCNPLIYDTLLEDAPVKEFRLRGPSGASVHGENVVAYPSDSEGQGHLLGAGPLGVSMAWMRLSDSGDMAATIIDEDAAEALVFPSEGAASVRTGGIVSVPPPSGASGEHALIAIVDPSDQDKSRVVRFRTVDFSRTDDSSADIVVPMVDGTVVPGFGQSLASANLDGAQTAPDHEVLVGSGSGTFLFDSVGANTADYLATRDEILEEDDRAFDGENEPDGRWYTLCNTADTVVNTKGGPAGADGAAAFVVAHGTGLDVIAPFDPPQTNRIGAPIYNCEAATRDRPSGSSDTFGTGLLFQDLDGDGNAELLVGDPGADRVYVFAVGADGLGETPMMTIQPDGDGGGFGHSVGYADLGGDLGPVLLIGAPGTTVDKKDDVGAVHVLDLMTQEPITVLEDQTPNADTRHGLWVGGVAIDGREEIVVMGEDEGRVHLSIAEGDPSPGE